jgi:hypothetical protein
MNFFNRMPIVLPLQTTGHFLLPPEKRRLAPDMIENQSIAKDQTSGKQKRKLPL